MCIKDVYVRCVDEEKAAKLLYEAVTGHLEVWELPAEISDLDPCSVNIRFLHFEESYLEALQKKSGVLEVGFIDSKIELPHPETVRTRLLAR